MTVQNMERNAPWTAWSKMLQPVGLGLRFGFAKLGTECSKDGLGLKNPSHDEDPASSLTQHPQSTIRHLRSFSAPLCDLGGLYVHS
jgi:hypothetical protein